MVNDIYGNICSARDTGLAPEPPTQADDAVAQAFNDGESLWCYHNTNKINGIPVSPEATALPIDSEELLQAALVLQRRPKSAVMFITAEDTEVSAYQQLLDRVSRCEVEVIDELREFDAQHSRFIIWVRYNELQYVLHPRFEYLKTK